MADGTRKPIDKVKIGDSVTATDPKTGTTGPHKVTALIRHKTDHTIVDVKINGVHGDEIIAATDHHPIYVTDDGGRWVDAGELRKIDHLRSPDGTTRTIDGIATRVEHETVYNLTIDGVHAYYVGDSDPVLVHNSGVCNVSDLPSSAVCNLTTDENFAFQRLNQFHAVDRIEFGTQIHEIKFAWGLPADFDLSFGPTRDVWNSQSGELLGHNVHGG